MAKKQVKENLNLVAISMKGTLKMANFMVRESISSLRRSLFMKAISNSIISQVLVK